MEHSIMYILESQVESLPFSNLKTNLTNGDNHNFQINIQIDSMMLFRRLSIIICLKLQKVLILFNFLIFSRCVNEDSIVYVKRFVEEFITILVINHSYYLI